MSDPQTTNVVYRTFLHHSKDWRFWACYVGTCEVSPLLWHTYPHWICIVLFIAYVLYFTLVAFPVVNEELKK